MPSRNHAFTMMLRDYEILQIIGQCGALTAEQIGLYIWETVGVFTDKMKISPNGMHPPKIAVQSNCQKRMKLLHEAGFVQRVERFQTLKEGKKSYFYSLTSSGAESLASFLDCTLDTLSWRKTDNRLRPNYVEHLIMENDVRLAVMRLTKKKEDRPSELQLIRWRDELMLARDHKDLKIPLRQQDGSYTYASLVPDAYFVLRQNDGYENHYILEIDRGTETAISSNDSYRTWAYKMSLYMSFIFPLRSGDTSLYTQMYQTPDVKILTVTTSTERLQRLVTISEKVGAQKRFWFTTITDVMQIGLQPIIGEATKKENPRYEVILPNIWSDKIWRIAKDAEQRLHSLSGRSEETRRHI